MSFRKAQSEGEGTSPATDMLACGLGAAMILTLLFIGQSGDAFVQKENLILVTARADSQLRNVTLKSGARPFTENTRLNENTCFRIERADEILIERCELGRHSVCKVEKSVKGVCGEGGWELSIIVPSDTLNGLGIVFDWSGKKAEIERDCNEGLLESKGHPIIPVVTSYFTPAVELELVDLSNGGQKMLSAEWHLDVEKHGKGNYQLASPNARRFSKELIGSASTIKEACKNVQTFSGIAFTPLQMSGNSRLVPSPR